MAKNKEASDNKLVHQSSDIDELENGNSSDESVSIEGYLGINTDSEDSSVRMPVLQLKSPKENREKTVVRTRPHVETPTDNQKNRSTRELRKRRTLSDYFYENASDQEEECHIEPDTKDSEISTLYADKVSSGAKSSSSVNSIETEFKYMLAHESENFKELDNMLSEKKPMLSTLGKHNFANIFEGLVVLQANQDSIVSNLKCICDSNKSQSVEDLMNKLCERQEIISDYFQLLQPQIQNTSMKLQCRTSTTCQKYVEMLKKPTHWTSETLERIKRIESYMKKDDPSYKIITAARKELLDSLGDLLITRQIQEPIKYSILVEFRKAPIPERKMASVFLFEHALVCTRQKVIILRKHFTQDSESEAASISTDLKDQSGFAMNARSISRYEIKWFVPLNQLDSLDTKGIVFDENSLRERLETIESLKDKIVNTRKKLQEEMGEMGKESKRHKLKIRRFRSQIYNLQAQLILHAPKLPLFINTTDEQTYCLLMSSEKERIAWKSAITLAKANFNTIGRYRSPTPISKRSSIAAAIKDSLRLSSSSKGVDGMELSSHSDLLKNELSFIINHWKQKATLNKLGRVVLSGNAISGILEVCVHEATGLTDNEPYYVAIEVDFCSQFELVAKTKCVSNTRNPHWNQSFILELATSQTICFTLFRHSTALGQLELPLHIEQMDQKKESYNLTTFQDTPKSISLKISLKYIEGSKARRREDSRNQSDIFRLTLADVLKRDQTNLEHLQRQISTEKKFEKLRIPVLVTACVEEVERRGLQEEGIYRMSGTATAISYLRKQFDEDASLAANQVGDYDINTIASLLKIFFRDLPESVIPNAAMMKLIKASGITNESKKMREFGRILRTLPQTNLDTFLYLLDHLIRVSQYESQNKMSINNLSIVWAMALFKPENPTIQQQLGQVNASEADDNSLQSVRTAATMSLLQVSILSTILEAYAAGKLDLSTS